VGSQVKRHQPARRGAAAAPPLSLSRVGGPGFGGLRLAPGQNQGGVLSPRRRRAGRIVGRTRRAMALVLASGVFGAMVLGGLLLITPSVTDAPTLVRGLDNAHGVPYPGPAVPERFAAALGTTALSRGLAQVLYAHGRSGTLGGAEIDLLAMKLDVSYPAARILKMYASVAYFGHGWYGLKAASCGYFGTSPERLSWAQAAMLVGVASSPASRSSTPSPQAQVVAARALTLLAATGQLPRAQARQADPPLSHLAHGSLRCGARRHRTS
jgi:transglycosylase-like protein